MTTAYGFVDLKDLYAQRVSEVGVQRIWDAVRESAGEYSRVANGLLAEFAEMTTVAKEQIELPGDGTLQPLDEHGNPLPVAPSGYYSVAYPIQGAGTAWGTNRVSRELLTVQEAERFTLDAMQRDGDWLIRHMLAGIFDNVAWTFNDKIGPNGAKGLGDITIEPLANGDTVTYKRKGNVAAATDDHYLATASAIADATNPFPTINRELSEHPSNGNGRILVYAASDLIDAISGLSSFVDVDDPDVMVGDDSDRVSNVPVAAPGDEVIGKVKGTRCWIVEWSGLPATYMIAKVEGIPLLKMREYPAASLQGFFPEFANVDGNHTINRMLRYAGFGVSNRVAGLVYRIGNGTYAIPSGYGAPLSV